MKLKTTFFSGGSSLWEPVDTEKLSTETYPEYGTRHGGEVVTVAPSRSSTNHLRTTITFQDEEVIQVNTWRKETETHAAHVDRHVALVAQIIETWP